MLAVAVADQLAAVGGHDFNESRPLSAPFRLLKERTERGLSPVSEKGFSKHFQSWKNSFLTSCHIVSVLRRTESSRS
jgi:hypothetical protein